MANLMLGFEVPTTGAVLYRGKDLKRASGQERRTFRKDVQAIFQDPYEVYNPFYRVDHVLRSPLPISDWPNRKRKGGTHRCACSRRPRPEETLGRYPHQFSGGQRQRIMMARTFLLRPKVIIADEPVSMVDASFRATIIETCFT